MVGKRMILNILFFIVWTVIVLWFGTTRARKAMEVINELQEVNDRNRKVHAENLKNNAEMYEKLKLRSEQNDVLMQTIKILNDKLNNKGDGLNIIENFSGLLGKQYLFLQEDNITYYNRYTDEYLTEEEAIDWLYSKLSEVINK